MASVTASEGVEQPPIAAPIHPARLIPPMQRRILMTLVMFATVMQTLDSTIANVALPHMRGSLGASPESINWVLTSYIVASAIATPVTGWLSDRFSRRTLLLSAVVMFTAASFLCAISTTLPMIVAARLLQGMFGAFILPIGQSLVLDMYPQEKHAQAMTMYSLVVLTAPVMGPVLGGWLTDQFDWRWVFLINLPIGAIVAFGIYIFMPVRKVESTRFDIGGFALLFVAVGALQLMLDRGTQNDWFESTETIIECALAVGAGWAFMVHTITARAPILPALIFRDRNLSVTSIFAMIIVGLVLSASALLPPMLQALMGHDAFGAGVLVAPRGLAMCISMVTAGWLVKKMDPRILLFFGLATTAVGLRIMMHFNLDMDSRPVILSGLIQGFGFGFVSLPMNLSALATLDPKYRTQGAGLFALSRNLGGSIVIALMSALLVRQQQVSHADIAAHVNMPAIPYVGLPQAGDVPAIAMSVLNGEVTRQAAMISYTDVYTAMFWMIVISAPLVLLMRPSRPKGAEDAAVAATME